MIATGFSGTSAAARELRQLSGPRAARESCLAGCPASERKYATPITAQTTPAASPSPIAKLAASVRSQRADQNAEQQRHRELRDTAAQVSPAGGRRVGRAHAVRREHLRRVILRDDEREHRSRRSARGTSETWQSRGPDQCPSPAASRAEQAGVRKSRTEPVAQPADQTARQRS